MPISGASDSFLGQSSAADALRQIDWATHPLGPMAQWSHSLCTLVSAILHSAFPQCIVWGPQRTTIHNDAFLPILGRKPNAQGRPFDEVWSEVWDAIGPMAARAYAGEATFIEDFPLIVHRGGFPERAYFTFCYSPIRDDDGSIMGMLDTVVETTRKVRAEKLTKLINSELAHRIQNTLAIVNSIADQTFRSATSLSDARITLTHRIGALGQAHDALIRASGDSAPIGAVIESSLGGHKGALGQITAEGPPIQLSAKQSLSLGMAVHELATNATKYGALSAATGNVTIRWMIEPVAGHQSLRLSWIERGGPPVTLPTRLGFGTRLIEQVLAGDFGGKVTLEYHPEGLRFELVTQAGNLS